MSYPPTGLDHENNRSLTSISHAVIDLAREGESIGVSLERIAKALERIAAATEGREP